MAGRDLLKAAPGAKGLFSIITLPILLTEPNAASMATI